MEISGIEALRAQVMRPEGIKLPGLEQGISIDQPEGTSGTSFADIFRQITQTEAAAQQSAEMYATGASQNLHETMIHLQKADIGFKLLVSVRNKIIEAYQTVSRMS